MNGRAVTAYRWLRWLGGHPSAAPATTRDATGRGTVASVSVACRRRYGTG